MYLENEALVQSEAPGWELPMQWRGTTIPAWSPKHMSVDVLTFGAATAHACAETSMSIINFKTQTSESFRDALNTALIRRDALASSRIEEIYGATDNALCLALSDNAKDVNEDTALMATNIQVLRKATFDAINHQLLTVDVINSWHKILMSADRKIKPKHVGRLRDDLVFIGNQFHITFVCPSHEAVPKALEDLCKFINEAEIDAVALAALAHAQFEAIHPYVDGNGRTGRILISWILAQRLNPNIFIPVSLALEQHRMDYYQSLEIYRKGCRNSYLQWFTKRVQEAVLIAERTAEDITSVSKQWEENIGKRRSGSAVAKLADLLLREPVIDIEIVATSLGVSHSAARNAVQEFEKFGVIKLFQPNFTTRGRPRSWWQAPDIVHL